VERNHFSGNAFVDNGEQVGIQGTGRFEGNEWTIDGVGNYWSDFAGYDADGDGIGDSAYKLDDLFSELTDDHPELAFFAETPASRAVDLAAAMFPAFRPRPKVEDTAPLIDRPTVIAGASAPATPPLATTALASLILLGGAVAVAASSRGHRRSAAT